MHGLTWQWMVAGAVLIVLAFLAGRGFRQAGDRADLSGVRPGASGVPPPPPVAASAPVLSGLPEPERRAIADALAKGNKILAIKLLRDATGLGLKESKDAIESIAAKHPS